MTLGNRIRALRTAKDLSQPELAKLMGIEQSYLSKLENDKSIPSNEMFRQILTTFNLSTAQFLEDIDLQLEATRLRQIPDVESYLTAQKQKQTNLQIRFLYTSCFMIVFAAALFYAGYTKQLFSEEIFIYESEGIVLTGESKHIFSNWRFLIDVTQENYGQQIDIKRLEMERRKNVQLQHVREYQGETFIEEVSGGLRFFELNGTVERPRLINAWLQIIGVMLLVAGVLGFVIERRIFKS